MALRVYSAVVARVRNIVFPYINGEKRQVAKRQREKGFILKVKMLIYGLGRTVHLKMPSACGKEPP